MVIVWYYMGMNMLNSLTIYYRITRACKSIEKRLRLGLPFRCHSSLSPFPISFASSVLLSLSCLLALLPLSSSVLRVLLAWIFVWLEACVQFQYVLPFGPQGDKGG